MISCFLQNKGNETTLPDNPCRILSDWDEVWGGNLQQAQFLRPRPCFSASADIELAVNDPVVTLHRAQSHKQLLGYLSVRNAKVPTLSRMARLKPEGKSIIARCVTPTERSTRPFNTRPNEKLKFCVLTQFLINHYLPPDCTPWLSLAMRWGGG